GAESQRRRRQAHADCGGANATGADTTGQEVKSNSKPINKIRARISMRARHFWLTLTAGLAFTFLQAGLAVGAEAPAALMGRVTSVEEGPMEGVLVSAKKTGSTITITVVSDSQGQYRFPASRLEPGQYVLRIRAVGY